MKILSVTTALLLSYSLVGAAQAGKGQKLTPCDGSGGWGSECAYNRIFVVKDMTQMAGEVVSVDTFVPQSKMTEGVLLKVKSGKDMMTVHLGPKWYIDNQDIRIAPADQIEVRGSKIHFDGAPAIVAAEVIKGDKSLYLRDDQGRPVWSGWRQKQRLQ
ncbi:MAG: DNA-binding protein [Bdellovibrionales bacterium]